MPTNQEYKPKRPNYRLTNKQKVSSATGSPFDKTKKVAQPIRYGPSDEEKQQHLDVSAFSYQRKLHKPTTKSFLKKGHGVGAHDGKHADKIIANKIVEREKSAPKVQKPKGPTAFARRPNPPNTNFRAQYERGDLPVILDQNGSVPKIAWKCEVGKLDYHHYLPLFFDGLREREIPYCILAEEGVKDMIAEGGTKILPVIPQLIIPIKQALNTRDRKVMVRVLRVLRELVKADANTENPLIGQALVPYYRQILPVFNIFINSNKNLGDGIDYSQRHNDNLGELISTTLELFELYGGEDAFINIKYLIPTYQSVISN